MCNNRYYSSKQSSQTRPNHWHTPHYDPKKALYAVIFGFTFGCVIY